MNDNCWALSHIGYQQKINFPEEQTICPTYFPSRSVWRAGPILNTKAWTITLPDNCSCSGGIWLQIQTSVSVESLPFYKNRLQSQQISFCQIVTILGQNGANSSTFFSKNHLILWGSHLQNRGGNLKPGRKLNFMEN